MSKRYLRLNMNIIHPVSRTKPVPPPGFPVLRNGTPFVLLLPLPIQATGIHSCQPLQPPCPLYPVRSHHTAFFLFLKTTKFGPPPPAPLCSKKHSDLKSWLVIPLPPQHLREIYPDTQFKAATQRAGWFSQLNVELFFFFKDFIFSS